MATETIFDAASTDLRGRLVIEASAGTGKTWSLSRIVMRLVPEIKPIVSSASPPVLTSLVFLSLMTRFETVWPPPSHMHSVRLEPERGFQSSPPRSASLLRRTLFGEA